MCLLISSIARLESEFSSIFVCHRYVARRRGSVFSFLFSFSLFFFSFLFTFPLGTSEFLTFAIVKLKGKGRFISLG